MYTDEELTHGIRTQGPRDPKTRKRRIERPTPSYHLSPTSLSPLNDGNKVKILDREFW